MLIASHPLMAQKKAKIVGLVQIRNESLVIEQCLHALSLYTDAIVILDDASDDNTVAVCTSIASKYHIEKIICNETSAWLHRTESDNRQKLLDAGRQIGGTHFIILDADEIMTANCAHNNYLRNIILRLNPGDRLMLPIMHMWKTKDRYRTYFNETKKCFIFCDDGVCSYINQFLHVVRVPITIRGGAIFELENDNIGLLHFGYVNWDNVLIRQAWYKCLERIRNPQKPASEINSWYPCHKEGEAETFPVPREWMAGYTFFDPHVFDSSENWRCKQIMQWFTTYGRSHFADVEIWHLDWDALAKARGL